MGARYTDTVLYAFDEDGQMYKVYTDYSYSGGGGGHCKVRIGDEEYDVEGPYDDEPRIRGEYLPYLYVTDMESYFSDNPSTGITLALCKAGLLGVDIVKFRMAVVYSVNAGPYDAICFTVTAERTVEKTYDVLSCDAGPLDIADSVAADEWEDV